MKPIEPREALWTQANKADLRPGDIVRFTYAADSSGAPVVGKVAEVDHGDYIIYFEQQPEELQKFSRTAAAPITYDPDGRDKMIDLYLAPGKQVSKKYIFSREKLLKTPEGIFTNVQEREWPKWCDGKEATFDPKLPWSRGVVAAKGTEFSVYRDWCNEIEEEDNANVGS